LGLRRRGHRGSRREGRRRSFFLVVITILAVVDFNVIRRHEAKVVVKANQDPVRICGIENLQRRIFREREFLVGLPRILE
jgi:hypothetical protein